MTLPPDLKEKAIREGEIRNSAADHTLSMPGQQRADSFVEGVTWLYEHLMKDPEFNRTQTEIIKIMSDIEAKLKSTETKLVFPKQDLGSWK